MKWQATITRKKVMRALLLRPQFRKEAIVILFCVTILQATLLLVTGMPVADTGGLILLFLVAFSFFFIIIQLLTSLVAYRQFQRWTDGRVAYTVNRTHVITHMKGVEQKAELGMFYVSAVLTDTLVIRRKEKGIRSEGFLFFDSEAERNKVYDLIQRYQASLLRK